jgi:hypothetical protein
LLGHNEFVDSDTDRFAAMQFVLICGNVTALNVAKIRAADAFSQSAKPDIPAAVLMHLT